MVTTSLCWTLIQNITQLMRKSSDAKAISSKKSSFADQELRHKANSFYVKDKILSCK